MINFNDKPFNFLPFESKSHQFNLTCFYAINLLEQIETSYKELRDKAKCLTDILPHTDFLLHRQCFYACDRIIVNSKKLYNCFESNNSEWKNIRGVLKIKKDLWNIVKELRDTSAHFDERLKGIAKKNDRDRVFSTLFYTGLNSWRIELQNGIKGGGTKGGSEDFQEAKLYFSSWKGDKTILDDYVTINIYELHQEVIRISNSFESVLNNIISTENICCPSSSNLFISEEVQQNINKAQQSLTITYQSPAPLF
jgi:hypothetical protein